jgi:hypothetical protein
MLNGLHPSNNEISGVRGVGKGDTPCFWYFALTCSSNTQQINVDAEALNQHAQEQVRYVVSKYEIEPHTAAMY